MWRRMLNANGLGCIMHGDDKSKYINTHQRVHVSDLFWTDIALSCWKSIFNMRALHLPGPSKDNNPPFAFPAPVPPPSALVYTTSDYPTATVRPRIDFNPSHSHSYIVRVSHTALTRGELTWEETLHPSRFKDHGGAIPGHDLVGQVVEVYPPNPEGDASAAKTSFKVGDKVAALLAFDRDGAAAEFALAEAHELARVPAGIEDEELATVPLSGLSAWQALFEHGGLQTSRLDASCGEREREVRVLVTGASGSVGVMAVQIAKAAGCWVVGTCSARNVGFVKDVLGADEVVDYTRFSSLRHAFEEGGFEPVDIVVDTVGKTTLLDTLDASVTKTAAHIVSLAMPLQAASDVEDRIKAFEARDGKFTFFIVRPDGEQLARLLELVRAGMVRGFVDRVMELSQGIEAMEYVETGRARGKVVLKVDGHGT